MQYVFSYFFKQNATFFTHFLPIKKCSRNAGSDFSFVFVSVDTDYFNFINFPSGTIKSADKMRLIAQNTICLDVRMM